MHRDVDSHQWTGHGFAFVAAVSLATFGCTPASHPPVSGKPAPAGEAGHDHDHGHDHDDHEHPTTIAAGLDELEKVCGQVKESLAAGDLAKADDAVHMAGHLVEDLYKLTAEQPRESGAAKALDEIFECFDAMDTVLHAGDEEAARKLDYDAYGPRIEAAIESLRKSAR